MARNEDFQNVLVGEVRRAHGLRGEVRIEVHSDVPERFDPGSRLILVPKTGARREVRVRGFRPVKGGGILALRGVGDREQAEALRGARLEVDPSQVPEAPEGFYYYWQLTGCQCLDESAGELGEVTDIVEDGGGVLLEVRKGQQAWLIPFVDAFLQEVDVEARQIRLRCPEGLLETCVSKS